MKFTSFFSSTVLAALCVAGPSFATPTLFSGYDPAANSVGAPRPNAAAAHGLFLSAVTEFSSQDFEGESTGALSSVDLTFDGTLGVITGTLTGPNQVIRNTPTAGTFPTSGTKFLLSNGFPTFTFDAAIGAIGMYISDVEGQQTIVFERTLEAGGTDQVVFDTTAAQNRSPNESGLFFLGFIDVDNPFTAVEIQGPASDGVGIDDILLADVGQVDEDELDRVNGVAVPNPAMAGLLALGGLHLLRRRAAYTPGR